MPSGINATGLTFSYQYDTLLNTANIHIDKGKAVLITGPSGCGKSTLCYLLAGIYPRHAGRLSAGAVLIDGQDIHRLDVAKRAKLVAMMFQNPNLQFCMDTVENELIFCLENIATPTHLILEKVNDAIGFCKIDHLRTRPLNTLSGGEKQRVMLACMVILESDYLFLDEPFANLDPISTQQLLQQLSDYQKQKNCTLVFVDHQLQYYVDNIDEVIVLDKQGQILQRGINSKNLLQYKDQLVQWGIALPAQPYQKVAITHHYPPLKQPLFLLKNVCFQHKKSPISGKFYAGKITAITGKSGCGKTTLLETLAKMQTYQGAITFVDPNTQQRNEVRRINLKYYAKKVAIIFQNPQDQFVTNTVFDEILLSLQSAKHTKQTQQQLTKDYLQQIGLWQYRHLSPYMLSQGQQRLLAVMALLVNNSQILLCDEPTYGLDRHSAEKLMCFLQQQVISRGLTIIFTTHDQQLASDYGDHWYHYQDDQLINQK